MMTVQSPERKSKCCQFLSQKWRKKNTFLLYFTPEIWISESVNYESMGQYIVLNQLLTSLTFHTTFKNTTTLLRLGKRKEDGEPSRLTHFTSTQVKQENTIMSRTKKNSGSLRCILWAPLWSVQYLFTRAKRGNTLVFRKVIDML